MNALPSNLDSHHAQNRRATGALQSFQTASAAMARLRATFNSGRTRPRSFRDQQLAGILRLLREREPQLQQALREDLGKPAFEASTTEINYVAGEIAAMRKHLARWMKPERVRTALVAQPGKSRIYREPLGVVLVIGAWNYPLQLALLPLAGALAAGNCALVKPSELAPATSQFMAEHLPRYVDPDCVEVVEGGVEETTALLAERFDYIFFTGNGSVGRIVMAAAAKNLTPVTLELGGKSPCLVDRDANIAVAARRMVWGKFLNAGQTCIAPDYVLVHQQVEIPLLHAMKQTVREFFGSDPRTSPDFGRIVNERHYRRLMKLLPGSRELSGNGDPNGTGEMNGNGRILIGGEGDEAERYLAPTILHDVTEDAPVMQEEIFGPILPVLRVDDMDEAIAFVNRRPKPLALYLFSESRSTQARVLERTSSGTMAVNHTCMQAAVPSLPFGGVGASGMGAYHGKLSFDTFSHRRAVLLKSNRLDLRLLYPPYTATKQNWIRRLLAF